MTVTREVLNKIAEEYHLSQHVSDKHLEEIGQNHTLSWIFSQINGRRNVLELGYGDGVITDFLYKNGFSVSIVEGSSILAEKAHIKYQGDIQVHECLFENFEPNRKYDCIIAGHVFEHVDHPVDLLKSMKKWLLSQESRIIIIVPNSESIHRRLAVLMGLQPTLDTLSPRDHIVGHQRVYSLSSLRKDIEEAGYHVNHVKGFFFKPFPNSMMLSIKPDLIAAMHDISEQFPAEMLANLGVTISPM